MIATVATHMSNKIMIHVGMNANTVENSLLPSRNTATSAIVGVINNKLTDTNENTEVSIPYLE
jgi:hypothetical protein